MRKIILALILALGLFALMLRPSGAEAPVADESASLRPFGVITEDARVETLRNFLLAKNSPLAPYAAEFVREADENGLDWRLLAAISGVESSFGKRLLPRTFNSYGWGGGEIRFASWEESIEIVSSKLRSEYVEKGAVTISQIGRRYCPPNAAWAAKVRFFMRQIDAEPLALSLKP